MTIIHHKLLTREGGDLANYGWTHPTSMTKFVRLFIRSVIRKATHSDIKYLMTLSITFSVVSIYCSNETLSQWIYKGHFTHEPRVMTMKLWEPERKCPKTVPRHLQNHVVWSQTLKCSVKPYVTTPSTKRYFNEFLSMRILTHDKIK